MTNDKNNSNVTYNTNVKTVPGTWPHRHVATQTHCQARGHADMQPGTWPCR